MLEIYQAIANLVARGGRGVVATVIASRGGAPRSAGAKMLVREDNTIVGTIGGGNVEHLIRQKAVAMMGSTEVEVVNFDLSGEEESPGMICGGQMDVLLEPIVAPETLYLFGAGHISQGVAAMAKRLGFRVVVVDPRAEYNNSERLPTADSLVVDDYVNAFSKLGVGKDSYLVILTPGHVSDEQCLELAVGTDARYIGMIGSANKVKDVKKHLLEKGVTPQVLDAVHAPIGLAIGAESPDEIAVSILAEIIKVRRGTS
ncbi:MAG TPA: xanthine dehydrogenase [Dehalococcoidia bacterium]|nr:xanthine dehydrogenase [Dehalococcoidia bacterium]